MEMKKALVVGIDNYPKVPLGGCANDAEDVAQILERHGDGIVNFSVDRCIYKETDRKQLKKGQLKSYIQKCFEGDCDYALFYFSGHGLIDSAGGYIVTPDYVENDWGISMLELHAILTNSKCKNKFVILDCCHAGFIGKISDSDSQASMISQGVTILTVSKENESAMEVGGHGIFTTLLLDALRGGAADVTGCITSGGIYAYIDRALGPWQQRPVFKTNVTQFSPIRKVKPLVDIDVLRKITEYFDKPTDMYALDPSFEKTNSPTVEHPVKEPYANEDNVKILQNLQALVKVGLVVPYDEEHMYYAAMNSKSCKLTPIGQYYWRLVNDKKI